MTTNGRPQVKRFSSQHKVGEGCWQTMRTAGLGISWCISLLFPGSVCLLTISYRPVFCFRATKDTRALVYWQRESLLDRKGCALRPMHSRSSCN